MSAMRELILVLHIFLAIIWAGGIMFIGWGVFPASLKLPLAKQRYFLISLMKSTHHLFSLAGFFVIITGILLGTVFGPIRTWDYLWSTTYGNIFVVALLIGIITLLWGIVVGYREMRS